MVKSRQMDMTSGPLLKKLIIFALPIVGINVLQILFNAADVAVLGIFASDQAVAAVGSTTSLVNLFVGFFVGLSLSANVLVARSIGANDSDGTKRYIGTSVFLSLIFGVMLSVIGVVFSKTFLTWVNCPESIIDMSAKYMRIYFLGMPIIMLYNFSAAIMRAVGDTVRPLIYLVIGGALNLLLNVFFIVVLKKDVEGVAIATVASQGVTAILSLIVLSKGIGVAKLEKKHLKIYKKEFAEIMHIGLPTGLQRSMFSISNVVLASTLNGFGDLVVAGNTIGHQFDAIIHDATDAFASAALSFISQNVGAKNFKRIWKIIYESLFLTFSVGMILGVTSIIFAQQLCGIMSDSPEVISYGVTRIKAMGAFYFLTGFFNVFSNILRAIKKPTIAMIGSILTTVVFRLFWIYFIFPNNRTLNNFYIVYPISWLLCVIFNGCAAIPLLRKMQKKYELEKEQNKELENNAA